MRRVLPIVSVFLGTFLLIFGGMWFFFQTSHGKKYLGRKFSEFCTNYIQTEVTAEINYRIPDWIEFNEVLIKDPQRDTLLAAEQIKIDLDMWSLLHSEFQINQVLCQGLVLKLNRRAPQQDFNYDFLLEAFGGEKDKEATSSVLQLQLDQISLENSRFFYKDEMLNQETNLLMGKLETGLEMVGRTFQVADILVEDVVLNGKLTIQPNEEENSNSLLPDIQLKKVNLNRIAWNIKVDENTTEGRLNSFFTSIEDLELNQQAIKIPVLTMDIPYFHYHNTIDQSLQNLANLQFNVKDVVASKQATNLEILSLKFEGLNKFQLQDFMGKFQYTSQKIIFDDVFAKTLHSTVKTSGEIRHANFPEFKWVDELEVKTAIEGRIGLRDLAVWLPEQAYFNAYSKPNLLVKAKVSGSAKLLAIEEFQWNGFHKERFHLSGEIGNVLETSKITYELTCKDSYIPKELLKLYAAEGISTNYQIPAYASITGTLQGSLHKTNTNLSLKTDLGQIHLAGDFQNFLHHSFTPSYQGTLELEGLNLGGILKSDTLGLFTSTIQFTGSGLDQNHLHVETEATIDKLQYKGYSFSNMALSASIQGQKATFHVISKDPNLPLSARGNMDLERETFAVKGKLLESNLLALNLYHEPLKLGATFDLNLEDWDFGNLQGQMLVQDLTVLKSGKSYQMQHLNLKLNSNQGFHSATLISDFANLKLQGNFEYSQIAAALMFKFNQYFELPFNELDSKNGYQNFDLQGTLSYAPILQSLVPEIQAFDPIEIEGKFNNQEKEGLNFLMKIPFALYDSMEIKKCHLNLASLDSSLVYTLAIQELQTETFRLRNGNIEGKIKQNQANFKLIVKDSIQNNIHSLAGRLSTNRENVKITLEKNGTLLHYQPWVAEGDLLLFKDYFLAEGIQFQNKNQLLQVSSKGRKDLSTIAINAKNIDLNALAIAFLQDSTMIKGLFSGSFDLLDIDNTPRINGNLGIQNLEYALQELGTLKASVSTQSNSAYLNARLNGKGNSFKLEGNYNWEEKNPLDLTLDIENLTAKTVEAFSLGELKNTDGFIKGLLKVEGNLEDPIVRGEVSFPEFSFTLSQLGSAYQIKNQKIVARGQFIQFSNFELLDSRNSKLTVNGRVLFPELPNYNYKLDVKSTNFLVADAERSSNSYFYGRAIADANLILSGNSTSYSISGDVNVKEGSNIVAYMPVDEIAGSEMQQLIRFVDKKKVEKQSLGVRDEKVAWTEGSEINLNVGVNDKSELTILMDEFTGDYLRVRGNASLRTGYNKSGELFLFGDYNLTEGTYELSISLVRKKFNVLNGSYLRWTGDPLNGFANIVAAYPVETSLADYLLPESTLPENTKDALRRPIPLDLLLYLEDNLLNIRPSFAVSVKEENLNARGINNMDEIRNEGISVMDEEGKVKKATYSRFVNENYVNQQALWLLASNRFSPLQNVGNNGGFNAESTVRQSVSRLLSAQLEQLASGFIKGVDLDIGVASAYESATGERSTELNLGLSKAFLNNRLSVSVGRNFELEESERQSNEVFDNITASYKLTENGQYRLRAYRKNQYQAVLEGFVVETGVGFSMVLEYDKLINLVRRKEDEEE